MPKYCCRFILILFFFSIDTSFAQQNFKDFVSFQRSFKNVDNVFKQKEDTLKKQFKDKGLTWPAKYMYIRSFKYDGRLEVWVKNSRKDEYKLFKNYRICALAGTIGPKRMEGDFQVPEGFYYISEFKANSSYDLALGVNYPNASDRILSDSIQPGSDIYIHGNCVTVGCIPMTDPQIEEIYTIAAFSHNEGQDYIPIHVYPVFFATQKNKEFLNKILETKPEYDTLIKKLKYSFYYFEKFHNLPIILSNGKGNYVFGENVKINFEETPVIVPKKLVVKREAKPVKFDESEIKPNVNSLPIYPGGVKAFQVFLDKLGKDLVPLLPDGRSKAYVQVEYVVDKEGNIILPKVLSGANVEMNNLIIERFEAMPKWTPAIRLEVKVPIRLSQTIEVVQ